MGQLLNLTIPPQILSTLDVMCLAPSIAPRRLSAPQSGDSHTPMVQFKYWYLNSFQWSSARGQVCVPLHTPWYILYRIPIMTKNNDKILYWLFHMHNPIWLFSSVHQNNIDAMDIFTGKKYSTCVKAGFGRPWCSTKTDSSDQHVLGHWGNCDLATCPTNPS